MNTIVFGGAGFMGSHVADCLEAQGHKVTIFDLKESPYLLPDQTMIIGDILDEQAVSKSMTGQDYVYNFAGIADLDDATTKPLQTIRLNVLGNYNVMENALRIKAKRYIYASTIYVYSQKGGFYRCSKQAAEIYIEEYQRHFGLDYTILRFGTIYGPRADSRNSIFRYLKQALEKKRIVCDGSGDEMREYIHVRDAAKLSVDILADEFKNQNIIITGHHPMKFREMLSMINEILGENIEIEFNVGRSEAHYNITPYSFVPKIGRKLINNFYLDMGQGLLECLHDMYDYNDK